MPLADAGKLPDPLAESKPKRWTSDDTLLEECSRVYRTMLDSATPVGKDLLWEGTISKLFDGKRHLYSPVMKLLYDTGCCVLQTRGSRNAPSIVRVIKAPTLEEIKSVRREQFFFEKDTLSKKARERVFESQVKDLRAEVIDLRNRLAIVEAKLDGRVRKGSS